MASYNLGKVVGDDGVSLEYDWEGTSLGIKRGDEVEYTYVDLKGDKGDTGSSGSSGADGYSPTVSTSKEGKTTTIEITDKNGTHTATIQDGADGSNGVDGTSPTASVSKSGNTATITITDKNGTTTTTVSDGVNGTNGRDGYVQYTAGSNISIDNNVISATDTTYSAGSNISITNGEISADLSSKQDIIQYSTMPTASSSNVGSIVQFIGTTDTNYTNGYFYVCVEDSGVYSWENINVQAGGETPIYVWNGKSYNPNSPTTNPEVKELFQKIGYHIRDNTPFVLLYYGKMTNTTTLYPMIGYVRYDKTFNSLTIVYIALTSYGSGYTYQKTISNAFNTTTYEFTGNVSSGPSDLTGLNFSYAFYYTGSGNGALNTQNSNSYTPTANYNPATKKYVDDNTNPVITTDSGSTYTIASLVGNKTYKLGELTSLTITATTTFDRESIIYFTSGSTATSVSLPDSITNLGDAPTMTTSDNVNTGTCEASKSYIIAILNNIAVWKAY